MSGYNKGTCTPMFIAALFTIAKLWKQHKCPTTDEWIKKMWYTHFYLNILCSSLTALTKQFALWGKLMWQGTENGLQSIATKKLWPSFQHLQRNVIMPTTTYVNTEDLSPFQLPMRHWSTLTS
jgi:hypothetical protein